MAESADVGQKFINSRLFRIHFVSFQHGVFKMTAGTSTLNNGAESTPGRKLWEHPNPEATALFQFKEHVSQKYSVKFGSETDPNSLWQWSVDNLSDFWSEVWDYTEIRASRRFDTVRALELSRAH